MKRAVVIRPEAEQDLVDVQNWYESERRGLGIEFRHSVGEAICSIAEFPLAAPLMFAGIRRRLLSRFPYGLFYKAEAQRVVILACVHAVRDPATVRTTVSGRKR